MLLQHLACSETTFYGPFPEVVDQIFYHYGMPETDPFSFQSLSLENTLVSKIIFMVIHA